MKEQNVIEFYVLCNNLKQIIRTGWKNWNVKKERVESIAEHIFGVQMLAIAMWSQFEYDIDIKKVVLMLALHETEEIIIGDLTPFEITKNEKENIGHQAVNKIFEKIGNPSEIQDLIFEFDSRQTKEAIFAFQCDKLECDLQCKLYDEEHCVDLVNQKNNTNIQGTLVKQLLKQKNTWYELWFEFSKNRDKFDDNFASVLDFALKNNISNYNINKTDSSN